MTGRGLVIACAAALAGASPAAGSTASLEVSHVKTDRGTDSYAYLTYAAAPGERNQVTVTQDTDGGAVRIRDPGTSIAAGSGCSPSAPDEVTCISSEAPVEIGTADMGDGDDVVTLAAPHLGLEVHGGAGDDTLDSGNGIGLATLYGGAGRDLLLGTSGDDGLVGEGGEDRLFGGPGRDVLSGDGPGAPPANDVLDGGPGEDTVSYADHRQSVRLDLASHLAGSAGETDSLVGIEDASGGTGADVLAGDDGPNMLDARDSSASQPGDRLIGRGGSDRLEGDMARDALVGGSGADLLEGNGGGDFYSGGAGDDDISIGMPLITHLRTVDQVRCGSGVDVVEDPSRTDVVPSDCESAMLDAYIQAATRRRSGHFEVLVRGADNASTFPPCQVSARVLRGAHVLGTTNVRRVVTRGWTSATLQLTRAGARLLRSKRRVRVAIRAADTCRRGARLRPAGSFLVDL